MAPAPADQVSEQSALLKTSYPRRTDKLGMRFQKGHRTAVQVRGTRPLRRSIRRGVRGI